MIRLILILSILINSFAYANPPGTYQPLLLSVSNPATVTLTDHAVSAADASSYTYSSKSIGTAASGRRVHVGVSCVQSPAVTITSLTIGGVSATQSVNLASSGNLSPISIYTLQVDTGTTATIVVNLSGVALSCGIGVWASYDLNSSTPTATQTSTGDPSTGLISVEAGGVLIGYCGGYGSPVPTYTWTNLTETAPQGFDETVDATISVSHSGASDAFSTAQSSRSITCDPSSAGSTAGLVLAAFR